MVTKKDLIEVTFAITNKCNLACFYCFTNSSPEGDRGLSTKEIIFSFQKLKSLKAVNLTGGEIFLHKDIGKILQSAVRIFPHVHLITNGILIPKSFIPFFKKHNISFSISVDGPKNVHEKIRGKNTFIPTINNIKLLRKNNLYVNMQATISKINVAYIDYLINLGRKLKVNRVSFMRLRSVGRAKEYPQLILNKNETKNLNEKLYNFARSNKEIQIMLKDSFINTLNPELINKTKKLGPRYICGGCRAGMEMLYIEHTGDIYPCPFLQIPLGNILKDDVFDIWLQSPVLQNLRTKEKYVKCSNCEYWGICRGCRAESLIVSGGYLAPDPQCWR